MAKEYFIHKVAGEEVALGEPGGGRSKKKAWKQGSPGESCNGCSWQPGRLAIYYNAICSARKDVQVMLKVVGASWEQTRLFFVVLGLLIILVGLAIFYYEIPIEKENTGYGVTVHWSRTVRRFSFEFWGQVDRPENIPLGVGRIYYKPTTALNGWATVEIETSGDYPDWVQAYGAGLLEGVLSWQMVVWHWENTLKPLCSSEVALCTRIRAYLADTQASVKAQADRSEATQPFWHHVRLFYYQLDGLANGWQIGVERSRKKKQFSIQHEDFLWLNAVNEMKSLSYSPLPSSIVFLRWLGDPRYHYLLAHLAQRSYSEMLRMHKKYTFNFHETSAADSPALSVRTVTFTSYPGAIHSPDDYYQVYIDDYKRLTVAGSNIDVNKTLLQLNSEVTKVPIGGRVMAACRLSRTAEDWVAVVNSPLGREGTTTGLSGKQWLLIENSSSCSPRRGRRQEGPPCARNASVWLVEQVPGLATARELTQELKEDGIWISGGIPYLELTQTTLGRNETSDSRLALALEALEEGSENVTGSESLLDLLREPAVIALGRADFIEAGTQGGEVRHAGIIDIKMSDGRGEGLSLSGPPYSGDVEPFQWSSSILAHLPHHGQPDRWEYGPYRPDWVWGGLRRP